MLLQYSKLEKKEKKWNARNQLIKFNEKLVVEMICLIKPRNQCKLKLEKGIILLEYQTSVQIRYIFGINEAVIMLNA